MILQAQGLRQAKLQRLGSGACTRSLALSSTINSTEGLLDTREVLRGRINEALKKVFESRYVNAGVLYKEADGIVFPTPKPEFGDYQCNICMPLAKQLNTKPRALASHVIENLRVDDVASDVSVAGPGFLNFRLCKEYTKSQLICMLTDPTKRLGINKVTQPQRVVVDYSSPNIAKEMHVGHLRSTIIGDSLAKVFEFFGHDVLRLNHVGDWGTQFGMLIEYLNDLNFDTESGGQIGDLTDFYKEARKRFENDPEFQIRSRERVVDLQQQAAAAHNVACDENSALLLWKKLCDVSKKEFGESYALLDIKDLVWRGESFYNFMLPSIVSFFQQNEVATLSDGAICIFPQANRSSECNYPLIIQKQDGGYLYSTTDLAALVHRVWVENADKIVYVTDVGQKDHFKKVFEAVERAGLLPGGSRPISNVHDALRSILGSKVKIHTKTAATELLHAGFGVVLGSDGKRLKSRTGESIRLKELLNMAIDKAAAELQGRMISDEDRKSELSQDEVTRTSKAIGIAAVKYADLSMHREGNYKFSFDKMLSMNGNTAPYLLYAYARIKGIQRQGKAKHQFTGDGPLECLELESAEEFYLAKHLLRLNEVLLDVEKTLLPNKLCDYLYELSIRFNSFYENCPVLQAHSDTLRISRLHLCNATAESLKLGLDLLGINTVEKF